MSDQIDYQAVRKDVEVQLDKRKRLSRLIFFITSLFMYVLFMLMGWDMASSANILASENTIGAMVMLSVAGFIGVLFQFISVMLDTKNAEDQLRKQLMGEALGAQILRIGSAAEKAKPKREMTVSDDGELEPVSMDELLDEQETARRTQGR
jgi:uncharacterized membrane protein